MVLKTKLYPEECCEICNEIIHCHFDCPVCKKNSPTNLYGESCLYDELIDFACEKCKTEFMILNRRKSEGGILVEIEEVKSERK